MTADNHVSRGSPLIGAARQRFPLGELVWAASWLGDLGAGDFRGNGYVFGC